MNKEPNVKFIHFLSRFPEIDLPVTLTPDSHHEIGKHNQPLPMILAEEFLLEEGEAIDDYTEYMPCLRIPKTHAFHGVVYWKAGLLNYEYILISFDDNGNVIDRRTIAGTKAEGEALIESVATIDDDWLIYIVTGNAQIKGKDTIVDPTKSFSYDLELLPTGEIIQL